VEDTRGETTEEAAAEDTDDQEEQVAEDAMSIEVSILAPRNHLRSANLSLI